MSASFVRANLLGGCLLGTLFAAALFSPQARATGADACATTTVGVDTSSANTYVVAFNGSGFGETFAAQDTLVHAIIVWRPPQYSISGVSMQLFLMSVDATGRPIRLPLLLVGPHLAVPNVDDIQPVKYEFLFDPPLELPGRGNYFFTMQSECLDAFTLLADTTNSYADGRAWETSHVFDCSVPGPAVSVEPTLDLVFEVQFCDTTTLARTRTWGQLKTLYR